VSDPASDEEKLATFFRQNEALEFARTGELPPSSAS
jgi:hypothetical protein